MSSKKSALGRLAFAGLDYQHVSVHLVGEDGNAMSIISRVVKAIRRAGASQKEVKAFMAEAMSGDYNHLLQTVMQVVNVPGHCSCSCK